MKTNYFDDPNYQDVYDEFGPITDTIYIRALGIIYQNGYYFKTDLRAFAKQIYRSLKHKDAPSIDEIVTILKFMAENCLFDKELFDGGVITSHGIQLRFAMMATKTIKNLKEYLLLTKDELVKLKVLESENENHERKVKKSEAKRSKVKKSKEDEVEINIDKDFYEN